MAGRDPRILSLTGNLHVSADEKLSAVYADGTRTEELVKNL